MQAQDTYRMKFNDRDWQVECANCGKMFEATRSDASYCSARCRVDASRAPKRLQHQIDMIDSFSRSLSGIAAKYRRNQRVYDAMLTLRKAVDNALAVFEV